MTLLAALLLPPLKKYSEDQPRDERGRWATLYHGTRAEAVPSILQHGLHAGEKGLVWATESREHAQSFAEHLDYPKVTRSGAAVVEIRAPKSSFFFEKPITPGRKDPPGQRVARFVGAVKPEWIKSPTK